MALLPSYQYSSLEYHRDDETDSNRAILPSTHIRLLTLDCGQSNDKLSCSLEQHSLASAPDYEAISYVWGDPSDTCDIVCSGRQLTITRSLHSALSRFRFASQERVLWADAVCINQNDPTERSAQVLVMSKIYSQARQVLIWLGEETERDSEALNGISQLHAILPTPPSTVGEIHELNSGDFWSAAVDSISEDSWRQLGYLLQKPWFQRVWVIQEVLMAKSAQLFNGSKTIAWSTFAAAVEKITAYNLQVIIAPFKFAQIALKNISLMNPENPELRSTAFTLLSLARDMKCTDSRDKIYALSGICDSEPAFSQIPNYTLPASQVFIQYTKQEIASGSLAHLSATDYFEDPKKAKLPTWVPDWSLSVANFPFEAMGAPFCAGGTITPSLSFSSDDHRLIIKGKKLSNIERLGIVRFSQIGLLLEAQGAVVGAQISTAKYSATSERLYIQWFRDWITDCHKISFGDGFSPTLEMFNSKEYHRFCKAIFCSNESDTATSTVEIVERMSKFYMLLTRSLESQDEKAMQLPEEEETEMHNIIMEIDRFISLFAKNRYFFCDDSGRLGWAPTRAQAGDVVCVFLGAKVPHLLRRSENGCFKLIGECYVQDCMEGEIIEAEDIPLQDFVLI